MNTKELKNLKNKSTLYIKYVDFINNASDSLYAVKKNDNRWQVGTAILSDKQISSIYNKIDEIIDKGCECPGFHYWMSNNFKQRKQKKLKRVKITVVRAPRHTRNGYLPLRIREKTVRVKRATVQNIKIILKKITNNK